MDKKSNGFDLVKLIFVIAIVGIIVAIAVLRLIRYRTLTEEGTCDANRKTAERMYSTFLLVNGTNGAFDQFVLENFKVFRWLVW